MKHEFLTSEGKSTIPVKLKRENKLKNRTKVYFCGNDNRIEIEPITSETIRKNIGILGTKGKLLKAFLEEKKKKRIRQG
ncbi:MAG: hypothetical protein M0Q21_12560 [Ignavibacteriaceae bacterium]|nr:hypothetical protein [Ignavibacteriaceae bacterium]